LDFPRLFFSYFFYYWTAFDTLVELHLQRVGLLALTGFPRYNGRSIFASASLLIWINRQLLFFTTQSVVIILILFILLHLLNILYLPPTKAHGFGASILSCVYHCPFSFPSRGGVLLFYLLYYPAWRYLSMLLHSISVVVDARVILSLVIPSRDFYFFIRLLDSFFLCHTPLSFILDTVACLFISFFLFCFRLLAILLKSEE
jgi:hypothetical protein